MAQRTAAKDPAEVIVFAADFSGRLDAGETITSIVGVAVSVDYGADSAPSDLLNGASAISGAKVLQGIHGGVDGADYKIKVEVGTSSGRELVIAGIVPVRSK